MTATTYIGPYDVTDYATWKAALDVAVVAGESIEPVRYGSTIIFVRVG